MDIDVFTPVTPLDLVHAPDVTLVRGLIAGSGIVGTAQDNSLKIDYEGNKFGAVNIVTYADRCYHAADRHLSNYPTTARAVINPATMAHVGQLIADTGVITLNDDDARRRVLAWTTLADDELDAQLLTTTHAHLMARSPR